MAGRLAPSRASDLGPTVADLEQRGTPFEVTIFGLGDAHVSARSNESGYANCEVRVSGD